MIIQQCKASIVIPLLFHLICFTTASQVIQAKKIQENWSEMGEKNINGHKYKYDLHETRL